MSNKVSKNLYIITIIFFTCGFFNIIFSWLGLICMILPFVLLYKNRRKTWCQNYCPRASLYCKLFSNRSLTGGKAGPKWLIRGKVKLIFLVYFVFNLLVIVMSTFMVLIGRRVPVDKVKFLIAFQLPWNIQQILNLGSFPNWVVHFSFRLYSMMFTTTVLGLLLAWIFRPRTWCTICPINTVSDLILNDKKNL